MTAPPLVPDDKDWTWVLDRPCPGCGFDTRAIDPADVGGLVRENASQRTTPTGRSFVHEPIHHLWDVRTA